MLENAHAARVAERAMDAGLVDDALGLSLHGPRFDFSNDDGKNNSGGQYERKGADEALALLEIKNLHVAIEDGTEIVRGVDLALNTNEVHAVMGPNGSGKSTLAYALMGHPAYEITEGDILLDGESVLELEADERARDGLFLAFQYPHAVPGRDGHELPALGRQRHPQGEERRRGRPDPDPGVPRAADRAKMDLLKVPREMIEPLPERGLLGRREEAGRDPPDGDARAAHRRPRRDRLGARHRRAARSSPRA